MGRNRKKSGAGSVEATRYDVFGNALPEAGAAQPSASSEFEANGVIKTQDLPEGWEAAVFGGGQRSLRGGVDGRLPDGRLITIKNQGIGGMVVVNIEGKDYYYPVENMRDYVVEPDPALVGSTRPEAVDNMTVFDYKKLIPEVMQAV